MKNLHLLKLIFIMVAIVMVQGQWMDQKFCASGQTKVTVDGFVRTSLTSSPTNTWSTCTFLIKKNPGICQLRLDFPSFRTSSANSAGDCDVDKLTIRNSVTVDDGFSTCGDVTGQHMYLTFGETCDTIEITPKLSPTSPFGAYSISMTPIPCSSPDLVPSHCLQNYNASYTTGVVRSFDYPNQQQNSQKYTVCVQSEDGKEIIWKPCTSEDGYPSGSPFSISSKHPEESCDTDWIGVNGDLPRCSNFPGRVTSTWKPFLLNVNLDDLEIPPSPLGDGWATDPASCVRAGPNSGGLFICEWFVESSPGAEGSCQCEVNPILLVPGFDPTVLFGPRPDIGNTGFCLRYDVQI